MVSEWVDESLAAAVWAVRVGVVSGPAEVGAVGAFAWSAGECLFESCDAVVEVHVWLRWWRTMIHVVLFVLSRIDIVNSHVIIQIVVDG